MENSNPIVIEKILNDDVKTAVFNALKAIHAEKLMVKENMIVLLKPNVLNDKSPEKAATTHPAILQAVIQWVKQFNPKQIYVADSSGGISLGVTERNMQKNGIQKVCDEEKVTATSFEKTERMVFKVPNPLVLDEFPASSLLKQADLIINLPVIKTHGQCVLTCCIKNMFGTILLGNKSKTHARFSSLPQFGAALADIYSVSHPQLTIVDGYLCQEGQGPSSGDVVKLDLILAGYDPVALDTVVCKIVGIDPKKIIHIVRSEEKKLGTMDLTKVHLLGSPIESVYRKFKLPKVGGISIPLPRFFAEYTAKTLFKATVSFNPEKCQTCGVCWKNCPVNAITPPAVLQKGNVPKWNKQNCITCYCCGELCPHEAVNYKVDIAKNVLTSWFIVIVIGFILGIIALIRLFF